MLDNCLSMSDRHDCLFLSNSSDDTKSWLICDKPDFVEYSNDIQAKIKKISSDLNLNDTKLTNLDEHIKEFKQIFEQDNRKNSFCDFLNNSHDQTIQDCLVGDVVFQRPADHRIEETDLMILFNTLKMDVLLQIFGSLLLERKVVLVGKCLRYEFSWFFMYQ